MSMVNFLLFTQCTFLVLLCMTHVILKKQIVFIICTGNALTIFLYSQGHQTQLH